VQLIWQALERYFERRSFADSNSARTATVFNLYRTTFKYVSFVAEIL
jgi:hypothetical protein